MSKVNYSEISMIVNEMTETTNDHYNSYAFAAGYLCTVVSDLIATLPKHKQLELLRTMEATTRKYTK